MNLKEKSTMKLQNRKRKMKGNLIISTNNLVSGITLIALVVTIVVLLILAGVTINVIFSEDGIIKKAGETEEPWKIGTLRDRIENIKMGWITDKLMDETTTIDDLWNKLKEDKIIDDPETDVEGPEREGENDVYQVTTNDGYVVEVIVDSEGNVTIGDIVKENKLPPKINKIEVSNTTNSATIKVEVSRLGNGKITYLYKLAEEENYTTYKETTETIVTIPSLLAGKVYNIKVVATNDNGSKEEETNILTGTLASGTISQVGETIWNNGLATIELETTATGYTLQYQVNSIAEGTWKKYTGPISGLSHGDTVFARIFDEVNGSEETTITIQDNIPPTITEVMSDRTTNSITLQVTATDVESGMQASPTYTFYIKKQTEQDSSYTQIQSGANSNVTKSDLIQNTTYTIKVEVTDKAGNTGIFTKDITTRNIGGATEGLQTGVIVASAPIWSNGTASIALSTATGLTIQWQKGGITEGNWTTGTNVTGINHNETIFARLTDGKNYGDEASVTIIDGTVPSVTVTQGTITTKSILVSVTSSDVQSGMPSSPTYNYYIKKSTDNIYPTTASYTGTNTSYTFDNLEHKTSYDMKVTTQDIAGNTGTGIITNVTTNTVGGATSGLREGNIIASTPTWSNGTASITLSTTTGLTIQWQKGGIAEGNWTTGTNVTGINHNETIFARLTDGKNYGDEASVTIIDGTVPSVTVTQGTITTKSILVSVTSSDAQGGMPSSPTYNYYIKKSTDNIYPTTASYSGTNTSYTFDNLEHKTSYDVKVTTQDIAGNTGTGIITNVTTNTVGGATEGLQTGVIIASSPTWSNGTASITLSTTTGLTIQWQKGGIAEGNWTTGTQVTGINHNEKIFARLTDGKNYGDEASVTIIEPKPLAGTIVTKPDTWTSTKITPIADGNGGTVPLPNDFYYIGGDYDTGLVISDKQGDTMNASGTSMGNQFVWIPVANEAAFTRTLFDETTGQPTTGLDTTRFVEPYAGGYATEVSEYNTMKTKVLQYGGFYIGRYEAGVNSTTLRTTSTPAQTVASKKGVAPYNYVPWGASMRDIGTADSPSGAVYLATNFATQEGYTSVTSTLCYGCQWDAMCRYIGDSNRKLTSTSSTPRLTGSDNTDVSKNIYDLAGGCFEWTMERVYNGNFFDRVLRGGYYLDFAGPVGYRNVVGWWGTYCTPDYCDDAIGVAFRCTLYIK